ncbi:MAG: IS1380 family transposase, partial [Dermatophilaceae bacterium]
MAAGADSIDGLQVIRSSGMQRLRRGVCAGHAGPIPAGVHPRALSAGGLGGPQPPGEPGHADDLLAGIETQAFIDIDSLLRPVYGHAKQGASFGH